MSHIEAMTEKLMEFGIMNPYHHYLWKEMSLSSDEASIELNSHYNALSPGPRSLRFSYTSNGHIKEQILIAKGLKSTIQNDDDTDNSDIETLLGDDHSDPKTDDQMLNGQNQLAPSFVNS